MNELAVIVDIFPFYTSMDVQLRQVYLCSLLNSKEGQCNALINGLPQDEGGGRGRATQGKFDIFRLSNVNFPTLGSPS